MKYYTKNQFEHNSIIDSLESEGIPFEQCIKQDSSFPSLNEEGYGVISVEPVYDDYLNNIYDSINSESTSEFIEKEKNSKNRSSIWTTLLVLFGIVMSLLYIRERKISSSVTESKNFNLSWNAFRTVFYQVNKETGKVSYVLYDNNSDLNYEKIEQLYESGVLASVSLDANEDGYAEISKFYSQNGELTGREKDSNNDHLIDYVEFNLEDGTQITLEDNDKNGKFSIIKN